MDAAFVLSVGLPAWMDGFVLSVGVPAQRMHAGPH